MINTQVTDITWLTRRLQGTQQANIKAEDVDEFEEDIAEILNDIGLDIDLESLNNQAERIRTGARLKAFDNLLVRLENKEQS
jgi:GTP cyclohydrolase I